MTAKGDARVDGPGLAAVRVMMAAEAGLAGGARRKTGSSSGSQISGGVAEEVLEERRGRGGRDRNGIWGIEGEGSGGRRGGNTNG